MSVIGDVVGGILGAGAAKHAANTEATGAEKAQQLELQNQQAAQGAQNTATSTNQTNQAPFLSLGQTSAGQLGSLLQQGFQAPTLEQAEQTPGYQFALQSGTDALDKSAAARGDLFSGTQGMALQKFGQNLGTQNYQQTYNNALNNFMTNYQTLAGGTQIGQQSANELGSQGQAGAQNLANIDLTGGQQQSQQINNAAAARASGYLGKANAYSNMIGGIEGNLNNAAQLFAA